MISITHIAVLVAVGAVVAGCQTTSKDPEIWVRIDGRPMTGNPSLAQGFHIDSLVCQGEMAKIAGVQQPIYYSGLAGAMNAAVIQSQRNSLVGQVGIGCMAERGYVLVPSSLAAAKAAEFRRAGGKRS